MHVGTLSFSSREIGDNVRLISALAAMVTVDLQISGFCSADICFYREEKGLDLND